MRLTSWTARATGQTSLTRAYALSVVHRALTRQNGTMSAEIAPFSFADIRAYALPQSLDELQGPASGTITLPHELAWSGRRRFDLADSYDRLAMYKIVLEEGDPSHLRRLLNRDMLLREWPNMLPARQVRSLWERRFPQLRQAA